jgi:hypothetical protein
MVPYKNEVFLNLGKCKTVGQEGNGSDQVMATVECGCDHSNIYSVKIFGHGRS